MSDALALPQSQINLFSMNNTKEQKKKVIAELKSKLEQAKLNLIYTELEELKIPCSRNYETVLDLKKSLKKSTNKMDYNKVLEVIEKVDKSLGGMVEELEKGSTNAFTKLMTSDLSKTIAKTLGISLAGRTALILAPTIGTKALVATGLGAYSIYRLVKNRKEIVKANQVNELNNILMELESTKKGNDFIDTRFDSDIQTEIRKYLEKANVDFEDTGYRSLREAIYSLDLNKKRSLVEILNNQLGKGIDIDDRMNKAKKKLNVVATTATTMGVGSGIGLTLANSVNSIDPALGAGILNGTVLGAWIEAQTHKHWYTALAAGLGLIGSEVLEHLPIVGKIAEKVFAVENLAAFCTIGATGGLIAGGALTTASIIKNVHSHIKADKETKKFVKLDSTKYQEEDKQEMEIIRQKLHEPKNDLEIVIIDIVLGYLKDNDIQLESTPKSVYELKTLISNLDGAKKKKAQEILTRIMDEYQGNPAFLKQLEKAGKISIGLFTSGLAIMSVYDILKGGTFLPELSQKLFPANNIHAPIEVPESFEKPYDLNNPSEARMMKKTEGTFNQFQGDEYLTAKTGDYIIEEGANYVVNNDGIGGTLAGQEIIKYGMSENILRFLFGWTGLFKEEMVPNIPQISEKISELSPERLYEFYRYYNTLENDGSEIYQAVGHILGFNNNLDKVSAFVNGYEKTQELHNLINNLSSKIATGAIPLATALETIGVVEKSVTTDNFRIK